MITYRITNSLYNNDISGNGAKINGGRWNSKGIPLLYTSQYISLTLLEMLVHSNFSNYTKSFGLDLLYIFIPDNSLVREINAEKLKKDWIEDVEYTRFIGDEFIKAKENLILKVPSVVVTEEYNFLLNPLHTDFKKIKINKTNPFKPDQRLFHF
ncbi:RES family NAD+ phosphorylase [Ferruginibacter albus]|uniref:RES family NAD+ phosphorylase n=1 Tax=Ferruginibacter albus TaxID=2875540 RepID=UPI001CC62C52|nr:RES family NAD+ phosphorylase [Ferruginibacter albus]UAY51442.1 RES family NAD+ phosphorylase [Ferruginibacter albus]